MADTYSFSHVQTLWLFVETCAQEVPRNLVEVLYTELFTPEPVHAGEILKMAQMFSKRQVSHLLCFTHAWRSQCFASITGLNLDEAWGGT